MAAEKPESLRQAQTWERVKNTYRVRGLCWTCSAQAAYGHQLGFARIEQPCPLCVGVVADLPKGEVNGWRSMPVSSSAAASTTASGGEVVPLNATVDSHGALCARGKAA
jgi:hypothetical protein